MRQKITKATRQLVYDKYNGHCAYCGKEITLKDMQVDHAIPIMWYVYGTKEQRKSIGQMMSDGAMDSLENYMPSCRSCNYYKGMNDIEGFRTKIKTILEHTCCSSFQTRLAMQYGIITYHPWDEKFYFETVK